MRTKKKQKSVSPTSIPSEEPKSSSHPTTAIQNNFNFRLNMDVMAINELALTSPSLADRAMAIYENQLLYTKETDEQILALEDRNKILEETEAPFIRKFTFRGQLFAFLVSGFGLVAAIYFGTIGMEWAAVTAITIPLGTLAAQFLGRK